MTAFYPISPMKAVEFVEAAGVPFGKRVIADRAAAGLIKSYALAIETVEVDGRETCVRGAAVPAHLWQRIMREGMVEDVWTGGTVRLMASEFIGGAPEVRITGIGFSEKYLQRVVDLYRGVPEQQRSERVVSAVETIAVAVPDAPATKANPPAAIPPGALVATVSQTMTALGLGRTKVTELVNDGTLVRKPMGDSRAVRIDVASIRAFAGLAR